MAVHDQIFDVWKTTIEMQKHLSSIILRIRTLAILTLLFFAASYIWMPESAVGPAAGLGALIWTIFFILDQLWYGRLQTGAVYQALKIEKKYLKSVPFIDLTGTMRYASISRDSSVFNINPMLFLFYIIGYVVVAYPIVMSSVWPHIEGTINNEQTWWAALGIVGVFYLLQRNKRGKKKK